MSYRILFIHESGDIAGAENSLIELVSHIDRERFEPVFACPPDGEFAGQLKKLGMAVYPLVFPRIRSMLGVPSALAAVVRIVDERKIDLVHSNSIRTHIYGAIAGKMRRAKVIWHERNLIDRELIDPERVLGFLPDSIVCNSHAIAMRFMKKGIIPDKVTVIHNGVDTDRFNPSVNGLPVRNEFGLKEGDMVIGIASRFNINKGHETFLEAARIVTQSYPSKAVKFLIAGGGVFSADKEREWILRKLCVEKGISERVAFAGVRKDMPSVYAAMDMLVLASDAEPCGRVILEAMASGKPVIGTVTGGTPEMIKDGVTGLLFKPGDAHGLAGKIVQLAIGDGGERISMGKAARERAQNDFSIGQHVSRTERLYDMLLGGRS